MTMYCWWLLLGLLGLTASVRREELYPFGEEQGDQRLPIGDDENSPEFQLDTPIAFYDYRYRSIYINTNGALSFEREYPSYSGGLYFPVGVKVIAPFLADVDTRLSGNVFYRETADPSLLDLASQDIQNNFPNMFQFRASHLLIVTWHDVGYYRQQYDRTNTFQTVVASDGFDSFAFFLYQDGGIQWVMGEGKDAPQRPDIPAHAGFDSGDLVRYHTLPGSGNYEVDQIALTSNMGAPGKWVFHIGLVDSYIGEPNSHVTEDNTVAVHPESCAAGGASQCHGNAACRDEFGGFCCQCLPPTYGNGITCMEPGSALRVNGKVSGTVNGYSIDAQDLHAYVVTKDGRSYTAISRLPLELGVAMQAAYPVGSLIGWLFAATTSPNAKNGAMLTGGNLNRTAVLRYVPSGQTLQISQTFVNEGTQGALSVTTTLNGEVPELLPGTEVRLDDYTENYNKESPGVLRSSSQQTYLVGGLPHRFMLDQTIRFQEPCSEGVTASSEGIRLEVVRPYIVYGEDEEIVRYAMTNRVSLGGSGGYDPCQGTTECDVNAICTSQGDQYTCDCQPGYQGDGYICTDVDECLRGDHGCDVNAQCYNREGSFECRCLPGYRGDGRTCQRDLSCADMICHIYATCVFDSDQGRPNCQCNSGYIGDGTQCEPIEFDCNEVDNCDPNADCMSDPGTGRYQCECMDGFSGDGYYCSDSGEPDINCRNCDVNARCHYDVNRMHFRCQCMEQYTGDGYTCSLIEAESCNVLNNCDYNARCLWGPGGSYLCECNPGYYGDGYRCELEGPRPGGNTCEVPEDCHRDATCSYNQDYGTYNCQCNPGFSGDGYYCEEEDCNANNFCDINAQCIYETYAQRYTCRCNIGYEGDGRYCRQEDLACNIALHCDVNAECMRSGIDGLEYCRCKPGYIGNGYACTPVGDCSLDPGLCDEHASCMRRGNVFVCACDQGYQGDGRRCAPVGDSATYLVYAQGMTIMEIPFQPTDDARGQRLLDLPGQTAIGIDVDCYTRNIYWTDVSGKTISRAALDGSEQRVLIENLGSPEGVAIDWIAKNMYWTDSSLDRIEVAQLDGTHRTTLFDTELVNPRAIVLDSGNGLMFWSDWDRDAPKIESAYMDGTRRQPVVEDNLGLPNGLALDHSAQQLCWADAGSQHLECVNYDGRGRRVVYAFASYPFDLVFANDIFYWTDWDMNSLPNIDKYGGDTNEPLILPEGGNGRLYGIAAVRETCPRVTNACALNNGGCRFLCLPTPNGGRTCLCPGDIPEEECNEIGLVV